MDHAMAIAPKRLTRPKLGLMPETPHHAEGQIMDPRVSEPSAQGASPAATIAPEPLDEPQVVLGPVVSIDQRVLDHWATDEISLGDYVLNGGEGAVLAISRRT